ncbi:hypothetical protein DPMN_039374 [Dreissena polymorpha]|uniref:Uncharacterized protein n=1 Tax=Dreissena polymorpha TaxID=45954 RepID=A0A9D4MH95_DREPO|nr:hypothetical protein DPMN_039374 [Dreissena polymorpha]
MQPCSSLILPWTMTIAKLCDEDSDCVSNDGLDFQDEEDLEGNTNRVMSFCFESD